MDFENKKPISQKQREHLARAREAAARARKERGGLTEKQKQAVERMKQARAEKIAEKKAVQKGDINASPIDLNNGIVIEPAKWPTNPVRGGINDSKTIEPAKPVENTISSVQQEKQDANEQQSGDTWGNRLKRALGL